MKKNQMSKISMFALLIAAFSTESMYSMRRLAPKAGQAIAMPAMAQRASSSENTGSTGDDRPFTTTRSIFGATVGALIAVILSDREKIESLESELAAARNKHITESIAELDKHFQQKNESK